MRKLNSLHMFRVSFKYVDVFSCIFIYFHVFSCISMYFLYVHVFSRIFLYVYVFSYIFVWNPIALAWQSGKPNILRQGPAHVCSCFPDSVLTATSSFEVLFPRGGLKFFFEVLLKFWRPKRWPEDVPLWYLGRPLQLRMFRTVTLQFWIRRCRKPESVAQLSYLGGTVGFQCIWCRTCCAVTVQTHAPVHMIRIATQFPSRIQL